MERFFIVRRNNKVLFIQTSDKSMWEVTLSEYSYLKDLKKNNEKASIFRNCVNEVLKSSYSQSDLLSLSPKEKKEVFNNAI